MTKNRIEELDFARVIAMTAVIMIHVTSTYVHSNSNITVLGINLAFLLNQMSRFAVPLFILLSGVSCGLSGSYTGTGQFLCKRLTKTGIPYLIWSFIYGLYNSHWNLRTWIAVFRFNSLIRGGAPHLYFIIIIIQLYVLFPVLKRWVERSPYKSLLVSFIISYGIQKLFYFLPFQFNLIPHFLRPYLWILFPTWLFYFIMGLLLTNTRLFYLRRIASQNSITILLTTLLFAWIYTIESYVTNSLDSIKSPLNIYVPLAFLSSFAVWSRVGHLRAVRALTRFLAKHSMTVYFEHVLVLSFFRRFPFFARGMSGMVLLFFAVFMVSCLLAIPLDGLASMVRTQKRRLCS